MRKFNPQNPNDVVIARKYFHSDHFIHCYHGEDIDDIKSFSLAYVEPLNFTCIKRKLILVLRNAQKKRIKRLMGNIGVVIVARPKDWIGLLRFAREEKRAIKDMERSNVNNG